MSRYLFRVVFAVAFSGISSLAYATSYFSGWNTISFMQTNDPATIQMIGAGQTLGSFITINGFTSAGNCAKYPSGQVVVEFKTDAAGQRAFKTAQLAMSLGKTIGVWVNDTNADQNGSCYAIVTAAQP